MFTTQDPLSQEKKPFILWRPFIAFWHWMFPPTVAHKDRQSTIARIVGGSLIIVFCLGIVLFALMNGRKWHGYYKTWKSDQLVETSKKLETEEKLEQAIYKAKEAFDRDPENPNAIRSLARYATLMKRNEARYLWNKLRKTDKMSDEDTVWEIRALSSLNEDKTAVDSIERLLQETTPTPKIIEAADQVMQNLGRKRQLLDLLKSYVEKQPDDTDIKLMLAARQVQIGNEQDKLEGYASLWKLAEDKEKMGLSALEFLDKYKKMTEVAEIEKLISLLQEHPLASQEHKIAALRRLAELNPSQKDAIITKALEDRAKSSREDLIPLARWIVVESQKKPEYAELLLKHLPEEKVLDFKPLLESYLNAVTLLGQHEKLERIIRDPRTRLTNAEKSFYNVHLAFVTSKGWDEVNSRLVEALAAAQGSARSDMILKIAKYAEDRQHYLVSEQAYRAGTSIRRIERESYDGLLRITYRNGNSIGFMETASETVRRWPDNQFFLERYIYASLLSGVDIEIAMDQAQRLLDERPNDSQRKLIMALAMMRQMDPSSATKYLERINLSELSAGQGAVLCGIMHSAGIVQQAYKIAHQIPVDHPMLPEEQRFLTAAKVQPRNG